MKANIEFEEGSFGPRAVLTSAWHDSYISLLREKKVKELELNHSKGWKGNDLYFLRDLPELKVFEIIDFGIDSIKPIHNLSNLRKIKISTYCETPINFNVFKKLTECSIEWRKGSKSLFDRNTLSKLFINGYSGNKSEVFRELTNLEEFFILNSKITGLQGLSSLKNLKKLRLGNLKKLEPLQGLQNLRNLNVLEIQSCNGIKQIEEVFSLDRLKRFMLTESGNIESIKGLENLKELTEFYFYGSTNIVDGDLTPIAKLNNLENTSFKNRKHYSHRREELGKLHSS